MFERLLQYFFMAIAAFLICCASFMIFYAYYYIYEYNDLLKYIELTCAVLIGLCGLTMIYLLINLIIFDIKYM